MKFKAVTSVKVFVYCFLSNPSLWKDKKKRTHGGVTTIRYPQRSVPSGDDAVSIVEFGMARQNQER